LLEVFYTEDDETDNFDPYTTELNQDKQQEEDAGNEKGWHPGEEYNARERSSSLNVSGSNFFIYSP
jgi:hypothetical protein